MCVCVNVKTGNKWHFDEKRNYVVQNGYYNKNWKPTTKPNRQQIIIKKKTENKPENEKLNVSIEVYIYVNQPHNAMKTRTVCVT